MLELYQAEGCGYSATVRETLTDLGGQDQIPFLVDHQRGITMYESDAIVEYLEENYS
jgi:glutathione S-transferase